MESNIYPEHSFKRDKESFLLAEEYYQREILYNRFMDKEPDKPAIIAGIEVPLFFEETEMICRFIQSWPQVKGIRYTLCQDADQDFVIQLLWLSDTDELQITFIYEFEGKILGSKVIRAESLSLINLSDVQALILEQFHKGE
ncbi:MAG: hypothetical protein KAS32_02715 [Candidatus Peribacteraceae bacterium]|nr:hypothetical protein [Candidatus Peribacteraceae bacterium]